MRFFIFGFRFTGDLIYKIENMQVNSNDRYQLNKLLVQNIPFPETMILVDSENGGKIYFPLFQ
jgi:hypothetical protein